MSQKYYSIFEKYRARKFNRDLEELKNKLADRGLTGSGIEAQKIKTLIEDYRDEIEMKKEKMLAIKKDRKFSYIKDFFAIVIPIAMLLISICVFIHGIRTEKEINRPYLEVDASDMGKQLSIQRTIPSVAKEAMDNGGSYPFNDSFSFTIKNVGKLPASYQIDTSRFRQSNVNEILPPHNATGVIFPDQKIELKYDLKGVINTTEVSSSSIDQIKCIQNNECLNLSKITVRYGFQDDAILQFETTLEEKSVERNCDESPTPWLRCYANPEWVTKNY